jgi:hypothetical protein
MEATLRNRLQKHPDIRRNVTDERISCATKTWQSPFFEVARVLVRLDHVAGIIENANHCVM